MYHMGANQWGSDGVGTDMTVHVWVGEEIGRAAWIGGAKRRGRGTRHGWQRAASEGGSSEVE